MSKKWLMIPILLIFIFAITITGLAQYTYTQQSGAGYFVSEADKSDALEDTNELRMILDELGLLLGHSKYGGTFPADEDTTPAGTLDIFNDYLQDITAESIDDLSDVDTTGVADNKILKYDIATNKWIIADDEDTTYTSSDFTHDDLTGVTANEHIDWTTSQAPTVIHADNYTDTDTTYTAGTGLDLTGTVFSLSHLGFEDLADPAADRIPFWNDTTNVFAWKDYSTWDTAYGWGDHSGEGYLTAITGESINDLSDVDTTGWATDKVLKFDVSGNLIVGTDEGGSGATAFIGLTDTPANYTDKAGYFPKVNVGETALEFVEITESDISDLGTYLTDITGESFADLSDIPAPEAGDDEYYLKYDHDTTSYSWAAGAGGGASQLSDLSDVNTSTPTDKFVLVADGVDFESRALVEADISDLGTYLEDITAESILDLSDTPVAFDDGKFMKSGAAAVTFESITEDVTNWIIPQDYATGTGTSGDPWAGDCVTDAITAASAGDTIYLRAGYYEVAMASGGGNVLIDKALTIQGAGIGKTILVVTTNYGMYVSNGTENVTIRDLTIDGTTDTAGCMRIDGDYCLIENVELKNSNMSGFIANYMNYSTLRNIYAHDNGDASGEHGIHPGSTTIGYNMGNTYENIYVWGNYSTGISDIGYENNPGNESIIYNTYRNIYAWDNGSHGVFIHSHTGTNISNVVTFLNGELGFSLNQMEDCNVSNLTVFSNGQYGIYLNASDKVNLTNVIAKNNGRYGQGYGGIALNDSDNTRLTNVHAYDDASVARDKIAFNDNDPAQDTITSTDLDFLKIGFAEGLSDQLSIVVSGSVSNDGTYTVDSSTPVTADTITLIATDELTNEGESATVTLTLEKMQKSGLQIMGTSSYVHLENCNFDGNFYRNIWNNTDAGDYGKVTGNVHSSLATDMDFSGELETVLVGEAVSAGELLYFDWTDKEWKKANAAAAATTPASVLVVDRNSQGDGNSCLVLRKGYMRNDDWNFTGNIVYLSDTTAGSVLSAAPSDSGDIVQKVGVAKSADILYFNPEVPAPTTITVTDNESTNENNAIVFVADADLDGGIVGLESDGDLHYNPSTGTLTATGFAGNLTGNVTGDLTGNADTVTSFTPASGSLTLSGADALTLTTTAETDVTLPTTGTLLANVSEDATPELGGELDAGAHSIGFTLQTVAEADGSTTIDWKLGNHCKVTLGAQAETFTFTAPTNPCNITLIVIQDGVGGRDITWPETVKWLGTEATWSDGGAGKGIVVGFIYDGTNYWGQATPWES